MNDVKTLIKNRKIKNTLLRLASLIESFLHAQIITTRSMQMGMSRNAARPQEFHGDPSHFSITPSVACLRGALYVKLLGLLETLLCGCLATSLANLVCAYPFALDRPGSDALMIGVVAGEVAVLDEAPPCVAALEVDEFELQVVKVGRLRSISQPTHLTHFLCGRSLDCADGEIWVFLVSSVSPMLINF